MLTVHHTRLVDKRLRRMSVRRTTVQVLDVFSNTDRDASNWSSIVPSASAYLSPTLSSNTTDLACLATNTRLSSPRFDTVLFAMRPIVGISSTHPPAFS